MKNAIQQKYEILTPSGFKDFDGIRYSGDKTVVKIDFENNTYIKATLDHEFKQVNEYVEVRDLKIGDTLSSKIGPLMISDIKLIGTESVFDILESKDKEHSFYANDLISHNCNFLGSSATLIDPEILGKYNARKQFKVEYKGDLKVYQRPVKGANYVLGVDPAKGVKKDYSVIQVLKVNNVKDIEQVAVYRNNAIDYVKFSQIIMQISKNYNNAWCMIENNNEIGGQVTTMLHQVYGFEQMVHTSFEDIGIRADQKTKLKSNMLLKQYCEERWINLVDKDTINELFLYEDQGRGTYGVDEAIGNDDTVAALRWGLYFIETDTLELNKESLYEKDESLYLEMADDTEMPLAIIDVGGEILSTEDINSFWDDV